MSIYFYIGLTLAILHFLIFGILLLKYSKKKDSISEGITWVSIFGFGMSFGYLLTILDKI